MWWMGAGGGTPIGPMSANIIWLSIDPFLTQILTPLFTTLHSQWPLFFRNSNVKFRLVSFLTLCQFSAKNSFYQNLTHFTHAEWPLLLEVHPKKAHSLANTQWTSFFPKSYIGRPLYRYRYRYAHTHHIHNESRVDVCFVFVT